MNNNELVKVGILLIISSPSRVCNTEPVHNVTNKYIILPICNLHASYFTSISPPLCLAVDVVVSRPTIYKKLTIALRFWYDKITGNTLSHTYCGLVTTAPPAIARNSQLITTIGFVNCNCIDLSPIQVFTTWP